MTTLKTTLIMNMNEIDNKIVTLWTDNERQWEKAVPLLKQKIPELLSLGQYNSETRTGPAIWLRCVIAGKIPNESS